MQKPKILIVDDEISHRMLLRFQLQKENFLVYEAENGQEAMDVLSEHVDIRIILTDINMPLVNGFNLIKKIRKDKLSYRYIIVLTSSGSKDSLVRALTLGADDYLTKPVLPAELHLRIGGGIRLLRLESQDELILAMAKLAEYRSNETGYHLERVERYTRILAMDIAEKHPQLGVTTGMAVEISRVSRLHDIGKVAIEDKILCKPGKLTPEEFAMMKDHTRIGGRIIKEIYDKKKSFYLQLAYEVTMYHHEKFNGKGYPEGLKEDNIPISARITALADMYDALVGERYYKHAFSHETAKQIIVDERGSHLDPLVVDSFLRNEDIWVTIHDKYRDRAPVAVEIGSV